MELSGKGDATFHEAVGRVIRTKPHFPTVADVLSQMDVIAQQWRAEAPQLTPGEGYEIGRRNAERLALEGLPSDAMIAHGGGRTHVVGSPEHRAILAMYDRLIATLERISDQREQEAQARPQDADLHRRMLVLVRTLSETTERREHFAKTGETKHMGRLVTA